MGRGGTIESIAPPSIKYFRFDLGSLTYNRFPEAFSRDAAAFISGAPLVRFPMGCCFVAVVWPCIDRAVRSFELGPRD